MPVTDQLDAPRARFDRFLSTMFRTVVLQPTTYCPWACDYCYLPTKDLRRTMPIPVAQAVAASITQQDAPGSVEVVWHGGEPLATGLNRFTALLAPFEALRCDGRVRHAVQTGAGLINQAWCELFARYECTVGVSIDGPEWANTQRRDRAGRLAHSRIMRGIRTLQVHGIAFTAIAVVTPSTIGRAEEIAAFFEDLGCASVGFNLEEHEGANTGRPDIDPAMAQRFWAALWNRRAAGSHLPVRDLDRLTAYLNAARAGRATPNRIDPIPTIAFNGETVLLSPELAGTSAPDYNDFVIGNVLATALPELLAEAHRARYVREFTQALEKCESTCGYYAFCRGAQAANRYFEHGTLAATETTYCINTRQALVEALHETTLEP
jgi:uncharacterized protein